MTRPMVVLASKVVGKILLLLQLPGSPVLMDQSPWCFQHVRFVHDDSGFAT